MLKFYVVKRKSPKDASVKFYTQPCSDGIVGQQKIVERIVQKCTLSEGDVKACMVELFNAIMEELLENHHVKLDDFGIFSTSFSSKSALTADLVSADLIKGLKVRYRPAIKWYEKLRATARYQKLLSPPITKKSKV